MLCNNEIRIRRDGHLVKSEISSFVGEQLDAVACVNRAEDCGLRCICCRVLIRQPDTDPKRPVVIRRRTPTRTSRFLFLSWSRVSAARVRLGGITLWNKIQGPECIEDERLQVPDADINRRSFNGVGVECQYEGRDFQQLRLVAGLERKDPKSRSFLFLVITN